MQYTFQTKPTRVAAIKWTGKNVEEVTAFLKQGQFSAAGYVKGKYVDIGTPKGLMVASPGHWITKTKDGEFYPHTAKAFRAKYEEVIP